ncbi:uncharacterized protein [Dysidea avara]
MYILILLMITFSFWQVSDGQGSYIFKLPVTAPDYVCVNRGVLLKCVVQFLFDDGKAATLDAVWERDGDVVNGSTPRHELIRDSMVPPRVIGVLVKDIKEDDDGAEYTCTVSHAPDDFNSTIILNVFSKYYNFCGGGDDNKKSTGTIVGAVIGSISGLVSCCICSCCICFCCYKLIEDD